MSSSTLRHEVLTLYKELLHLGKAYPLGYAYFRGKLHTAFWNQRGLKSEREVRAGIERGRFVVKEIEALYYLKRYRTLRQRYDAPF